VLLRTDPPPADGERLLARGSARSVQGLDLYELFKAQADLLSGFGGHPLAAGLTLPVDNIPMLRSALNRAVREALGDRGGLQPTLAIDLTATVTDLGQDLFRELRVLEPYGMGNPVPRLLIRNAWFERGFHRNLRDRTGRTVKFIKTAFQLWDDTTQTGFPGEWWGHYKDELPAGRCDVVVELDHNAYQGYHVKLVDVRPTAAAKAPTPQPADSILDWRLAARGTAAKVLPVEQIPLSWAAWQRWQKQATQAEAILAVAYPQDAGQILPQELWQQLVGVAKFLARTQTLVTPAQLMERLPLTPISLQAGLEALQAAGLECEADLDGPETLRFTQVRGLSAAFPEAVQRFLEITQEEQFRRRYFSQVPVSTLSAGISQRGESLL